MQGGGGCLEYLTVFDTTLIQLCVKVKVKGKIKSAPTDFVSQIVKQCVLSLQLQSVIKRFLFYFIIIIINDAHQTSE